MCIIWRSMSMQYVCSRSCCGFRELHAGNLTVVWVMSSYFKIPQQPDTGICLFFPSDSEDLNVPLFKHCNESKHLLTSWVPVACVWFWLEEIGCWGTMHTPLSSGKSVGGCIFPRMSTTLGRLTNLECLRSHCYSLRSAVIRWRKECERKVRVRTDGEGVIVFSGR